MVAAKRGQGQTAEALLSAATDFHGHLGPFLALGVRLGLVGLRESGATKGDTQLHVTVALNYVTPISCILDGIQTATKCTVGNKRLSWKESEEEIDTLFQLKGREGQIRVSIRPDVAQELKCKLEKMPSMDKKVRQLALDVFSRSDDELFLVKHK